MPKRIGRWFKTAASDEAWRDVVWDAHFERVHSRRIPFPSGTVLWVESEEQRDTPYGYEVPVTVEQCFHDAPSAPYSYWHMQLSSDGSTYETTKISVPAGVVEEARSEIPEAANLPLIDVAFALGRAAYRSDVPALRSHDSIPVDAVIYAPKD